MPEDARGRALRLIELAVAPSANETEARNAAMAACKIIKEHKLLMEAAAPQRVRMHVSGGGVAYDMQASFDELFGQVTRQQQRRQQEQVRPTRPPPEHRVEGDAPQMPKDPNARTYVLSNRAVCAGCGDDIPARTIVTVSRRSVYHVACYQAVTT